LSQPTAKTSKAAREVLDSCTTNLGFVFPYMFPMTLNQYVCSWDAFDPLNIYIYIVMYSYIQDLKGLPPLGNVIHRIWKLERADRW
jgi:hypothetical protein